MTEQEWECSQDPRSMLEFLHTSRWVGDRKLRLFATGSCRVYWDLLRDERSRRAVEASEQYADGLWEKTELHTAARAAQAAFREANQAVRSADELTRGPAFAQLMWVALAMLATTEKVRADALAFVLKEKRMGLNKEAEGAERTTQSNLVRDLFGPFPFHPVTISPSVLAWQDRTIPKLALAAYDQRQIPHGNLDSSLLAVVADAVEEAGCDNRDLVAHLRLAGNHVRGCWAVDLVMGR